MATISCSATNPRSAILNPIEFGEVAGDDDKSTAARVTGYQAVIAPDSESISLEHDTHFASMSRGAGIEGKHL